jgi:hypothetical protein
MFAIECKDYASSVGVAAPRSLIASTFDATRWRRRALSHNQLHEGGAVTGDTAMAGRFRRTFSAIVAPNGFTLGAYQLATHYNIKLFDHVEHGTPQTVAFLARAVAWMNAYSG